MPTRNNLFREAMPSRRAIVAKMISAPIEMTVLAVLDCKAKQCVGYRASKGRFA